ncbi:hypothetical protein RG47T_0917 [Mucilaginibacter polytrichastri]|uniref:Uncharacterized protein n=1 Tax=Mucilaginibacter polytrichastri TaxID=1302689 RepID=A0A1Q5ZUL8_9SPHI|nr:hypothetical protein RG47T_0917 [Mucilaginibacter polytrichastri]
MPLVFVYPNQKRKYVAKMLKKPEYNPEEVKFNEARLKG